MTAYSTENLAIKAFRSGVTDYVRKPLSFAYLRGKLSEIFKSSSGEQQLDSVESREVFVMDYVEALIEENFNEDLTRDTLAESVHMDKYQFSRAFNKRFGKSVRSYINDVRVKKATELLSKNFDLSISDIAILVGYGCIQHFDKTFKKTYGMSPDTYRRNQKRFYSAG
jgi:YesN/AraC family two-component response regulator